MWAWGQNRQAPACLHGFSRPLYPLSYSHTSATQQPGDCKIPGDWGRVPDNTVLVWQMEKLRPRELWVSSETRD